MIKINNNLILLNEDVIRVILTHIRDTNSYMNCLYLCNSVYAFLMKNHEDKIVSFNLGIISLYKRYPHLPWNKNKFIRNKSIRIKDIINYTPELFKEDECYRAIFSTIQDKCSTLHNLSLPVIEEIIANNPNIHLYELFTRIHVFSNPNITFSDKICLPENHIDYELNGTNIMYLESLEEFGYSYGVSGNHNVNIKLILDNPDWEWCQSDLSCNPGITIQDIIANPQFDWSYRSVCANPNFTIKDYFNYKHLFGEYSDTVFSYAKIVPEDFILYPELALLVSSNSSFCANRSFTTDMFDKLGIIVDYKNVSRNPNITMKYVIDNINENFNWNALSLYLKN